MILKKYASNIGEGNKNGRQGSNQPATDLGEHVRTMGRGKCPQCPNTIFLVVLPWVSNGNDYLQSHKQLQASCMDVIPGEEPIDFIKKSGSQKEPYIVIMILKYNLG